VLRSRDRLSDLAWVRHVGHGEFGLIAGSRDLDRADAENAVEESLGDVHRPDVLERHRGAVLAEDAPLVEQLVLGDGERRLPRMDVPIEQEQDANAEGRNEHHAADEPERMRPEHRRMRLVDHRAVHRASSLYPRTGELNLWPGARKAKIWRKLGGP